MKAPGDGINATDDILSNIGNLQTPCRRVGLARSSGKTKVGRTNVKYKNNFLAIYAPKQDNG